VKERRGGKTGFFMIVAKNGRIPSLSGHDHDSGLSPGAIRHHSLSPVTELAEEPIFVNSSGRIATKTVHDQG
jgi:hypothetical protein